MRYRESQDGDLIIPEDQLASNASDGMLLLTATLGFLIALVFIVGGWKGKQMWIWVWGIGLLIVSLYMGVSIHWDLKLFGAF